MAAKQGRNWAGAGADGVIINADTARLRNWGMTQTLFTKLSFTYELYHLIWGGSMYLVAA